MSVDALTRLKKIKILLKFLDQLRRYDIDQTSAKCKNENAHSRLVKAIMISSKEKLAN